MNATQWIAAALRILSVYLIIGTITALPTFVGWLVGELRFSSQDPLAHAARWSTIGSFVGHLTSLVIAVLLWRNSRRLATQIWADTEPQTPAGGVLTADRVQLIAFSLFGLFLLINAAPTLLKQSLTYRAYHALPADFTIGPERINLLVGTLLLTGVQILLGLWLLLYPEGIARLLAGFEAAGSPPRTANVSRKHKLRISRISRT